MRKGCAPFVGRYEGAGPLCRSGRLSDRDFEYPPSPPYQARLVRAPKKLWRPEKNLDQWVGFERSCHRNCKPFGLKPITPRGNTVQNRLVPLQDTADPLWRVRKARATGNSYLLSPGGRYLIGEAFCRAASVSSTVSNGVVCRELRAPPPLIAIAVAAIETLSGASHKLYAS